MSSETQLDKNFVKLAQIVGRSACLEVIQSILQNDFDINYVVPNNGRTALHYAVDQIYLGNRLEVCDLLMNHGADFTLKDHNGFTPLRLAFEFFKNEEGESNIYSNLINCLLSAHLKFNNVTNPCCNSGISHLHIACFTSNKEAVRFFLEAGAPVNQAIDNNSTLLPGYTLMHIAMRNKDKDMVQLLVEYGADYNCLNAEKRIALDLLDDRLFINDSWIRYNKCFSNESSKNEYLLDLISQTSTDNFDPLDFIGLTQLHVCCIRNRTLDELERVLESNASSINAFVNFNSPIWPGYTALHFALHRNPLMAMFLIEKGADLMTKDANDVTPLDLCLEEYKPITISRIIGTQKETRLIRLDNGVSLIDAIASFNTRESLRDYLKPINVNSAIPFDSPVWPGYSFSHLAVLLLPTEADAHMISLYAWQRNLDFTIKDANNMTALHLAAYKEKWALVREFMFITANIITNPVDDRNLSHFHLACICERFGTIKEMLRSGVDVNVPTRGDVSLQRITNVPYLPAGSTPFHIAVAVKSNVMANLLRRFKADPHVLDADGFSPFHRAFLHFGHDKLVHLLQKHFHGLKSNLVAPGKLSYFHVAAYAKSSAKISKAVKFLLPLSENISEPLNSELMKYVKVLPKGVDLGDTPLHLAVKASSKSTVDLLLKYGASRVAKNEKGLNPIQLALLNPGAPKVIRCFLLDFDDKKKWLKTGLTRLHVACALRDISLVKKLLEDGEDVNSQIDFKSPIWPGYTPLHVLFEKGYPEDDEIVKLLLNHILENIEKPLRVSAKRRKVMPLLEKNKLPVNDEGLSAFHVSCMVGDVDLVERFIRCGADIDAPNDYFAKSNPGFSPLHFAIRYGSNAVLELLLKHGANISIENSFTITTQPK